MLGDLKRKQTFGMEKFIAFLKYCKISTQLEVDPALAKELAKHKKADEFAINVCGNSNSTPYRAVLASSCCETRARL